MSIRIVLFDVGGVLVELGSADTFRSLLTQELEEEHVWQRWLHSPAVRAFELGRIDERTFARQLKDEFNIKADVEALLDAFHRWPVGLFPGMADLIERIPRNYTRALLSNSNSLHWPRIVNEMELGRLIEHHFVSFQTGRIKPDADAFQHVIDTLGCRADEVYFLDDNQLNVDAASAVGLRAVRVRGYEEVQQALEGAHIV